MKNILNNMRNSLPRYVIIQPSTGKKVTFRPFTVKEEKYLMMAKNTGSYEDFLCTLANIINSCFDITLDAKKLPLFDIEYFFLKIRSKSINEIVEPTIVCPVTKEKIKVTINLEEIEPTEKINNFKLNISDGIIVNMKYPSLENLIQNNEGDVYDFAIDYIDSIETINEKIENTNTDRKEFLEFIELMTTDQFLKILNFIKTIPKIEKNILYKTSDGIERTLKLKGLKDFFQ